MGGIIDWLSGASSSANKNANQVGSYYNTAVDTTNNAYDAAGNKVQAAYAGAIPGIQAAYAGAIPGIQSSYQNAADQTSGAYGAAEKQLIDATGSPAAAQFAALQAQGLQPGFKQQQDALAGQLASQGIGTSGAGAAAYGNLAAAQSGALASADAPLYANAESQYGNLLGQGASQYGNILTGGAGAVSNELGAGASAVGNEIAGGTSAYGNLLAGGAGAVSGIAGSGAGAQGQTYTNTYNQSMNDFYGALQAAGSAAAGVPGGAKAPGITTTYGPPVQAQPGNISGQLTLPQTGAPVPGAEQQVPFNPYGSSEPQSTSQAPNYNPYQQAA